MDLHHTLKKTFFFWILSLILLIPILGFTEQNESENFIIGQIYHGFVLKEQRQIQEINAFGRYFIHEKTGARLFKLETDDDNKAFCITFQTLPSSDNGVAHVMEHSVLNGSRKYPVKGPFEILSKGSFATFLNAVTSADRTSYPLASRNEKDFYNLMDVYLDAVFYPNIYNEPKIFMQEGWHYHIEEHDAPLTYNGIVYNEMKGAFSSPDSVLWSQLPKLVLPNTVYANESGGTPEAIPDLTRERFIDFHKTFYHPSNSYLFLYGDGDTLKELQFLNKKYLRNFDKKTDFPEIKLQPAFYERREAIYEYPIMVDEDEKDKSYMALAFVINDKQELMSRIALTMLSDIFESSSSPLRQAIIQADLAKDMHSIYWDGIPQPVFCFVLKNTNPSVKEKFIDTIFSTLRTMVNEGIDRKLIESTLNAMEFKDREANYGGFPKGLVYNWMTMSTWVIEDDPFSVLEFDTTFKKMREELKTDYFENIVKRTFLDNKQQGFLIVKPKKGLEQERERALKEKLAKIKASMSDSEINKLIEQTKQLKEYQIKPDDPNDIAKIPLLTLADINLEAEQYNVSIREEKGINILHYPAFTNNIIYLHLIFDAGVVPQELIPYVALITSVLGELNTKNKSYTDLEIEEQFYTGGIHVDLKTFYKKNDPSIYMPKVMVDSKALTLNTQKSLDLQLEILTNTIFNDPDRLHEVIQRIRSRWDSRLNQRGVSFASTRVRSHLSAHGYYSELVKGLSYYKFLVELDQDFENQKTVIIDNLNKVAELLFNRSNLSIGIVSSEEDYQKLVELLPKILDRLNNRTQEAVSYDFPIEPKNEALLSTSKINYVAMGFDIHTSGVTYNGKLGLLDRILSRDYLHNTIRIMGGAYGAYSTISRDDNAIFVSYRDPHLTETIDHYKNIADYIKNFRVTDREMTRYIIGKIAELDHPLTVSYKGEKALTYHFMGITNQDIQQERDEILNATQEDIQSLAPIFNGLSEKANICVFGNEAKLKKHSNLFDSFIDVTQ